LVEDLPTKKIYNKQYTVDTNGLLIEEQIAENTGDKMYFVVGDSLKLYECTNTNEGGKQLWQKSEYTLKLGYNAEFKDENKVFPQILRILKKDIY
jgi:hypothetical protein